MSCASATSPISSTTGPARRRPRRTRSRRCRRSRWRRGCTARAADRWRTGQNVSMSRTGIEEATNSVASSGSSTPSSAATDGSLQPLAASTPRIASAARSSALRQLASQSGSGPAHWGGPGASSARARSASGRLGGRSERRVGRDDRVGARRVLPGALRVERDLAHPVRLASHVRNGFDTGRSPTLTTTSGLVRARESRLAQERVVVGDRRVPAPGARHRVGEQRPAGGRAERRGCRPERGEPSPRDGRHEHPRAIAGARSSSRSACGGDRVRGAAGGA